MIAWILALVLLLVVILIPLEGIMKLIGTLALIFFGLSAIVMALGNWLARNTLLALGERGINYSNGFHRVYLPWEEIERIEVFSGNFNDKIRVLGLQQHFSFETLGEIVVNGKSQGKIGFEQSEAILAVIFSKMGINSEKQIQANGYYYYLRQ